jgi:hypothetical protein
VTADETGRFADVSPQELAEVRSLTDFVEVVTRMRNDFLDRGGQEWGNANLDSFLEALAALAEDREIDRPPTWADVADLLVAATGYE